MRPVLPAGSRYATVGTSSYTDPSGREVVFLRRRMLPRAPAGSVVAEHEVRAGDRLDTIAARHLGDPEQFWQICDANGAMDPLALLEIGRRLVISEPEEA